MKKVGNLTQAILAISGTTAIRAVTGNIEINGAEMQITAGGLTILDMAHGETTLGIAYAGSGEILVAELSETDGHTKVEAAALFDVLGDNRTKIVAKDGQIVFGKSKQIGDLPQEAQALFSIIWDDDHIDQSVLQLELDGSPFDFYASPVLQAIADQDRVADFSTVASIISAAEAGELPGYPLIWGGIDTPEEAGLTDAETRPEVLAEGAADTGDIPTQVATENVVEA